MEAVQQQAQKALETDLRGLGHFSECREKCHFCGCVEKHFQATKKKRYVYYPLPHPKVSGDKTVLCHVDCLPCEICSKSFQHKGLTYENGKWAHWECHRGKDRKVLQEVDKQIDECLARYSAGDHTMLAEIRRLGKLHYGEDVDLLKGIFQ